MRDIRLLCICVTGPGGRELDIGALFEKYTIDEIRDIEKKTRLLLLSYCFGL